MTALSAVRGFCAALALLFLPGTAVAQEPARIAHGKVESRSAAGGLEAALLSPAPSPTWFGYAMTSPSEHRIRSGKGDDWARQGRCELENVSSYVNFSDGDDAGSNRFLLFYRVESGRVTRLRVFSDDCIVEAGGTAIVWLEGVRAAESVAYLEKRFTDSASGDRDGLSRERVLMAIALHDDPAADAALERFASPPSAPKVRKKAAFWLGNSRGRRGYELLRKMAGSDTDEDVRKSVTFALSLSPVPGAVETLIAMGRSDASSRVRGQALFWLAQKAGERAASTITDAIRDDPETEVKRKAVFALTQLPSEESATQLIKVARTNRNPEVRKQAMFWLGQSKDPRALAFIEEVLTR